MPRPTPTGNERTFAPDEFIVSKTDLRGKITYANRVFLRVAGYTEAEILGRPHSLVRHPAMPRCVFQLLWDTLESGNDVFAYVLNLASNGDHYWVFAHVTPSLDESGKMTGYHSNRRLPNRAAVRKVEPIYEALCAEEARFASKPEAIAASTALLVRTLAGVRKSYDEFVHTL